MIWENINTVIQIFGGYICLCVLLPAICLHPLVKGKSLGFRLMFYQVCSNMYLIFWGFALSYLKLFYAPMLWLVLVGLPLGVKAWFCRHEVLGWLGRRRENLYDISSGMYGRKKVLRDLKDQVKGLVLRWYRRYLSGRLLELLCLLAFFVFVLVFYGQYKFTHAAYAHTDEETHLYWIQSMIHNNIFPAGMYPHGMHFLVGTLSSMFGLSVVRTSVNFGIFSTSLILFFLYLLLRKVFPAKAAAAAGLGVFLLTDLFQTTTYFRFQMTFPMEFALVALFAMLAGLISYVQERDRASWWMFVLSLAWTFSVHFYVTIFAAFLCVAFGVVFLVRMVRKKILHKVLIGGLAGILLAVVPFGVGYLAGHPFERSIAWAFNVMGDSDDGSSSDSQDKDASSQESQDEAHSQAQNGEGRAAPSASVLDTLTGGVSYVADTIANRVTVSLQGAWLLLGLGVFFLFYGLVGSIFKKDRFRFLVYVFLALAWMVSCFLYLCYFLGLPVFIEMYRASTFFTLMTAPLFAAPVQLVCDLAYLLPVRRKYSDTILLAAAMIGMGVMVQTGHVKSDRYFQVTIAEADMRVSLDLVENLKKQAWTVVSTTNDLSVVRYDGFHYEIVDLIEELDTGKEEIYIPTKDIFVVVEEQVTQYSLADQRKIDGSDMLDFTEPVNEKDALKDYESLEIDKLASRDRAYYAYRNEMMSKLHYWVQRMREVFPNEVSVYYRDGLCTVYRITQDERFLLNLAVDYRQGLQGDVKGE